MDSGNQQKLRAAVVLLISFVLFGFSRSVEAQGAQIIVNTTADTIDVNPFDGICADAAGRCSLRAAIMTANAMPGVQSIFLRDGIYRITRLGKDNNAVNGDFDIRDSVVIIGAGPASTIIDANLVGHAFEVPDLFRSITLSITGVTIQNANGEEQYAIYSRGNNSLALTNSVIRDNYGGVWVTGDSVIDNVTFTGNRYETLTNRGGTMILRNSRVDGNITDDTFNFNSFIVYNSGTMTVTNTRFTNNYRQNGSGGAVYNTGYLRVRDTLFENNRSRSDGGALYHIGSSGVTEINRTRFINNSVDNRAGGAIYALEGTVNIRNSVFDGNQASPELRSFGGGGAISNSARMTIISSTFSNNAAFGGFDRYGRGGAIFNERRLNIVNSTISGNYAVNTHTVSAGGGIANQEVSAGAVTELVNVTITGNSSDYGGGIYAGFGLFRAGNSIIARNTANVSGADCSYLSTNTTQIVASQGHNLVGVDDDCRKFDALGDLVSVEPLLGPLADNGGFTFTHNLLAGSPAIDSANPNICPLTDQRGTERVRGCDIGAFEYEGFLPDPVDPENLIWNGSFERASADGPGIPTDWVFVNRTGERRVCGQTGIAPEGDCVLRFTPSTRENSRLNQNIRNLTLPAGTTLQISAFVNAPGEPRLIMRVRAFHTTGNGVDQLNLRINSTTDGYQPLNETLTLTADVNRVQISLHNRTNVGRVFIDNVRVVPASNNDISAETGLIPLPLPPVVAP